MQLHRLRSTIRSGVIALLVGGCGDADAFAGSRETLPDGTVLVSHDDVSAAPADTLTFDLVIGRAEGEEWEMFGRIADVAVGGDGAVYVLDSQAPAVRIYDRQGTYRASIGRRGDGPGELGRPNGILVSPQGTLWIRDLGTRRLTHLTEGGRELATYPLPTGGSTDWDAVIDDEGRMWQSLSETVDDDRGGSEPVLLEWDMHHYVSAFDPRSGSADSLMIGESKERVLYVPGPGGSFGLGSVEFDPELLVAIDRETSVWTASSGEYRVTRRGGAATPDLIIRLATEGPPLDDEQRAAWRARLDRAGIALESPERQPPLVRLLTDDRARLWVQRAVAAGEAAQFDAFTRDGRFLGSIRVIGKLAESPAPVIRNGQFYAVVLGELDVPQVVRAPLPELGG